jgi:hypothetical protein
MPCWLCHVGFSQLFMQLKADLRVSLWIVCAPNVMAVISLTRSNQNYPSVAPVSQDGFWNHWADEFWFSALTAILDPPQYYFVIKETEITRCQMQTRVAQRHDILSTLICLPCVWQFTHSFVGPNQHKKWMNHSSSCQSERGGCFLEPYFIFTHHKPRNFLRLYLQSHLTHNFSLTSLLFLL